MISEGDTNPFLGLDVKRPEMEGGVKVGGLRMGRAPVAPQMLIDLAAGRGIVRNVRRGPSAAGEVIVLDYQPPLVDSNIFSTIAAFRVPGVIEFQLSPKPRFNFGVKHVDFSSYPRFSKRFMVMANDEAAVRRVFGPAAVAACEALSEKRDWHMEAGSDCLLASFGITKKQDVPELVEQSARVAAAMRQNRNA